jgi:hypothetical protein
MIERSRGGILLSALLFIPNGLNANASMDAYASSGRQADSTPKIISEIRAAERRRIPIEVALKASDEYTLPGPVPITILITNLFDKPLLINRRLLVNHPRLQGEVSFRIIGPDGKRSEITRLITPMGIREDDFVVLPRGMSVQRTIDIADLYGLGQKGTYKIIAIYHNDIDQVAQNLTAWKGVVASDPIEITLQ